jgi:putative exosortase-associated protein (TIGR04073 family)
MRRPKRSLLALAIGGLVAWPLASAADTALDKAGRGLAAMTTPFLEIPGNIVLTTHHHGPLAGWTVGFARGIGMTAIRPLVGVYEFVTAPVPAPDGFEPILRPEYPWSYFGDGDGSHVARHQRDHDHDLALD